MATSEQEREELRLHAWVHQPIAVAFRHWDAATKSYRWPDGWPDGVDPDTYSATVYAPPPSPGEVEGPPASPSVKRLRKIIAGGRP